MRAVAVLPPIQASKLRLSKFCSFPSSPHISTPGSRHRAAALTRQTILSPHQTRLSRRCRPEHPADPR